MSVDEQIFQILGTFKTSKEQFEKFKSNELWRKWAEMYPQLIDEDDVRVAKTQAKFGYHFHEWLAAILLYQSTGYLSLIESYEFKIQKRKQNILIQLLPENVLSTVREITKEQKVQCPDLLCFKSDLSDWFFCEVKGPNDKVREVQQQQFQRLVDVSGKKIQVVKFTY